MSYLKRALAACGGLRMIHYGYMLGLRSETADSGSWLDPISWCVHWFHGWVVAAQLMRTKRGDLS